MDIILVNQALLESFWNETLGPAAEVPEFRYAKQAFIENFRRLAAPDKFNTNLYLDSRTWELKIKEHLFHHLKTESIVGVLLHQYGLTEIPALLVSALVSILIGPKKVKVSNDSESIYLSLILDDEFQGLHSTDEWYDHLPDDVRSQTNRMEFEHIMKDLVYAGLAASQNGGYIVYGKGKHKLKIHVSWD